MNHPLRASRAPSRGHARQTGEAGSAGVAGFDLSPAPDLSMKNKRGD